MCDEDKSVPPAVAGGLSSPKHPPATAGGTDINSMSEANIAESIITLYVVPDCPLCANVRAELSRRNAAYIERDVAGDFAALRRMYRLTRQRFVPVVEHHGAALVRPTRAELDRLLQQT